MLRAAAVAVGQMDPQRKRDRPGLLPCEHIPAAAVADRAWPDRLSGEAAKADPGAFDAALDLALWEA